ncbi:MAG: phosphopantothenoylcysteine decarboxylase domain-containing protein [Planctomycetota bacterium]|jgi:phosphopantothenoylcysteine decarboxylase/phosphopantothenate--cysteine ligase
MKILITAGPTCEDIDPVRYLTNRSSGKLGYAITAEAARRGHDVVLVSGPTHLDPPTDVRVIEVRSADDMLAACLKEFDSAEAAILVAAVADYRPVEFSPSKIKKDEDGPVLHLTRTPDVAKRLGELKAGQFIVGFAMESDDAPANAENKRRDKNMDAIIVNDPDTFDSDYITAEILTDNPPWAGPRNMIKSEFATALVDFIEDRAG